MEDPKTVVFEHLRGIADRAFALINDVEARRRLIEQYFCAHPSTAEVKGRRQAVPSAEVPMEWIVTEGAEPDRRILYLHGGSWISGSPAGYRALVSRLSLATGAVVLAVDYRLAPEHPFPAGLDDSLTAYRWMLKNGPDGGGPAASAYLMGDSAGGNLALASLLKIRDDGLTLPAAVVALSPATDFTGASPSLVSRADVDPIINPKVFSALAPIYLGPTIDPTSPYVSPLYGDFTEMPPLLLQVGDAEVLLDDSRRLADHAAAQGCDVTLDVWPGMPHVFQGFAPFLSEASEAIARIGDFIRRH